MKLITELFIFMKEIRENFSLIENPNVLNFQKWVETDKAGYLIRQYFINNLYDRIRYNYLL